MNRICIAAMVLSLFAVPARAAVHVYDWSFSGFRIEQGGSSGNFLSGRFVVDDANGDGSFTQPELVSFFFEGKDYARCPPVTTGPCGFQDFSYAVGGGLSFQLHSREVLAESSYSIAIVTGDYWTRSAFYPEGAPFITLSFWTGDTSFAMSPVPEPQGYLRWGTGLLAMGALAAWTRRAHPRARQNARMAAPG